MFLVKLNKCTIKCIHLDYHQPAKCLHHTGAETLHVIFPEHRFRLFHLKSYLDFYLRISLWSKFSWGPAVKIPQQIFHLQHPSLVTVAMHGGSLPSPMHPVGMLQQPGSLKTAFYITAHNERLHQCSLQMSEQL